MKHISAPLIAAPAVSLMLSLSACRGGETAASPPLPAVKVSLYTAEETSQAAAEKVPGSLRARLRAVIEAKVSGRIAKLSAVEGKSVQAAELLAELDVQEIKAKLDQAVAVKEQAERDLVRYDELYRKNATAREAFEGMQAKAAVARAAVVEAQTMLGYARITAPFNGVITRKLADVGDLAAPGKPLFEMEDPASLRFEASLPESLLGKAELGAVFSVKIASIPEDLRGKVSEVAPTADPNSRTFLVKLDLPQNGALRSGLFGHVEIPLPERPILKIPAPALIKRGQMEIVFVVQDGKARLRLVRSGQRLEREVEILAGISPGERLVGEGAAALRDGQPVEAR